jgi:hypothetical protein
MTALRVVVIALAAAVAIVPLPSAAVEHWYSGRVYPAIQGVVTPLSNRAGFALLDVAAGLLVTAAGLGFWRRVRRQGFLRSLAPALFAAATAAAVVYLAFAAIWGLNYRRVPLEMKIRYDTSRVTRAGAVALGERAAALVNAGYADSRRDSATGSLEAAFERAQATLGQRHRAVPGIPKRSLLGLYFRAAAIDGMIDPIFLEVILTPDALRFERPFILAHEWAHLAGYADESEANFVAWLTCAHASGVESYSGWLAVFEHVVGAVPEADGKRLMAKLEAGPRADLAASAQRYARSSPVVRAAARDAYDTYLRANRVEEGIESYSQVLRLMLGAGIAEGGDVEPRVP